ncbi:prolyl oligopeptidase family serine peptidase [Parasediminibacterium sp. JCM 36343]|uniref:prolyl oligopeptidase family serine peptidase n=1 Tax=Parasediminibacterium sp. JCM 36343 TaxID=3374279 RepID=UPI00397B92D8
MNKNHKPTNTSFCIILFFAVLFLQSCKKSTDTGTTLNPNAKTTLLAVGYGTDSLQQMDIFLPAGRSLNTTKIMVLVHGGSWTSGDKSDVRFLVDSFTSHLSNYAFININYRLATFGGINLFPTQEADVKQAFEYILSHNTNYQYDTSKLVLLGESAGGLLALLQAYKYPSLTHAAIDLAGVSDMVGLYKYYAANKSNIALGLSFLMNGTPTSNPTLYNSSSPVNYVGASSPPTIILHGTADTIVPITQSNTLDAKLSQSNVQHEFYTYPGIGHTLSSPATFEDAFPKVLAFLQKVNP